MPPAVDIGSASINYARYLGEFFSNNNARVDRNLAPSVSQVSAAPDGDRIQVSGYADDEDGTVSRVDIVIDGLDGGGDNLTAGVDGSGFFRPPARPWPTASIPWRWSRWTTMTARARPR